MTDLAATAYIAVNSLIVAPVERKTFGPAKVVPPVYGIFGGVAVRKGGWGWENTYRRGGAGIGG